MELLTISNGSILRHGDLFGLCVNLLNSMKVIQEKLKNDPALQEDNAFSFQKKISII